MKGKRSKRLFLLLLGICFSAASHALTVKNIELPEQLMLEQNTLVLNGAGIRSKFVFDIYVGALYVTKKSNTAAAIIADPGAKLVRMQFVYDEVSAEKMRDGWSEGFANVLDATTKAKMQPQIDKFNQAFGKTVAGDVIDVQYLPQNGTTVIINKQVKTTIPGIDFHQALMKIWLGDDPVDANLKAGMLGKTSE